MNNTQFWFLKYDRNYYRKEKDIEKYRNELLYDYNQKKWVTEEDYTGNIFPSGIRCASYKAAKRHLRKHTEIPKGTHFVLVSRYVGQPNRQLIK